LEEKKGHVLMYIPAWEKEVCTETSRGKVPHANPARKCDEFCHRMLMRKGRAQLLMAKKRPACLMRGGNAPGAVSWTARLINSTGGGTV